jgi:hypothetical protein
MALSGAVMAAILLSTGADAATCKGSNCTKPAVITGASTTVTSDSAAISGSVVPNGSTTTCTFHYGTTAAYGSRTANQTVSQVTATTPQSLSATLTGLKAQTAYHYQLVCSNAGGTTKGGDATFTTSDTGPSEIRLSGHTGFVSGTGEAGVFIGCYGSRNCTGSLKIIRNGQVIGQRGYYFIKANAGGIIHVGIGPSALRDLKSAGHYVVSIASTTTDGQQLMGGDTGRNLTLHIFH